MQNYCAQGVTSATSCPNGRFRGTTGGMQISDCVECEPGFLCPEATNEPIPCPVGHYCPPTETREQKCPLGTYTSNTRREFRYQCTTCPKGYYCNETGIYDLTNYICTEGYYCLLRANTKYICPAGTYRQNLNDAGGSPVLGGELASCLACPAGKYCPEGTVNPISCTDGHYCPEGSAVQLTCDGGFYCNAATNY